MYTQSDIITELEAVVKARSKKDAKNISSAFKAEMNKVVTNIKRDILFSYQMILRSNLRDFMHKYYGNSCNLDDIERGVSFFLTPNLEPGCNFNSAMFNFDTTSMKEKQTFNQNAIEDYAYMDLADAFGDNINESAFGEELVFDFIDTYGDDEYEGFEKGKIIVEPTQVFQMAKEKADVDFKIVFESQIKPKYL